MQTLIFNTLTVLKFLPLSFLRKKTNPNKKDHDVKNNASQKVKKKPFEERYFFASLKVYSPICQIRGLANLKPRHAMTCCGLSCVLLQQQGHQWRYAQYWAEGAFFCLILTPASQSSYYYYSRFTDGENYVQCHRIIRLRPLQKNLNNMI